MARRKNNEEIKNLSVSSNSEDEKVEVPSEIIEDNPLSKKVSTIIDEVNHNKNNELLNDSDLFGNIMLT